VKLLNRRDADVRRCTGAVAVPLGFRGGSVGTRVLARSRHQKRADGAQTYSLTFQI